MGALAVSFSKPIVNIRKDYKEYINKHYNGGGMCFGAALYWATQTLSETLSPTPTARTMLIQNRDDFFKLSINLHNLYKEYMTSHTDGYPVILERIKQQEQFLLGKTSPNLTYSFSNGEQLITDIRLMCGGSGLSKNKAIILKTRLTYDGSEGGYFHSTALVNLNGAIFFFDANRGVYHFGEKFSSSPERIIKLIVKNLGLPADSQYKYCDGSYHINIQAPKNLTTSVFLGAGAPSPQQCQMPSGEIPEALLISELITGWSKC